MYKLKKTKVSIKKVASFLNYSYNGKNFDVTGISSLNKIKNNTILFYSDIINSKFKIKDNTKYNLKKLEKSKNICIIASNDLNLTKKIPILISKNPRLDFQRIILKFFVEDEFQPSIHKTAIIEKNAKLGKDVYIGSHCYIGNNVSIGDKTKVFSNTCIYGNTAIGSNSIIKSNTTIGSEGFGFSFTGTELVHFASLGSVIIGDNVWIGSNCSVEKSQMDETIIEDHVKIDDLVQIGHNSIIKKFSQIAAGTVISGRAKVGKGCWIAPHVVIDNGNEIGDNCLVGTSSLVKTNFPKNSVIIGSPAKLLRKNV